MTEILEETMQVIDQELQRQTAAQAPTSTAESAEVAAKAPQFAKFSPAHVSASRGLDHLFAVKLEAEAVLGKATLTVDETLNLGVGSVIELDRLVSEPVDLIVQNVRVARGEVIVVNDQFAVRITEIAGAKS